MATESRYGGFKPKTFNNDRVQTYTVVASNAEINIGDAVYSDSDGKVAVIADWDATTYAQAKALVGIALEHKAASAAGIIRVYDACDGDVFEIQADDALAVTNTFNTIDFTDGGASTGLNGLSGMKADASSVGTTQVYPAMIVGFVEGEDSAPATAYQTIRVRFMLGRYIGASGKPAV